MDIREMFAMEFYMARKSEANFCGLDVAPWEVIRTGGEMARACYESADRLLSIMGEDSKRLDWLEGKTHVCRVSVLAGSYLAVTASFEIPQDGQPTLREAIDAALINSTVPAQPWRRLHDPH